MLRARDRAIRYPLLALARLVPRLTPGFLRAVGLSGFGLLCLLLSSSVLAGEVTLAWDPTQDPNLAGYRLYYGYAKGSYEGVLAVGKGTTYTLTDLEEGQAYYFVLVAYDVHGQESELSQEVAHNGRPTDYEGDTDENALPDQDEADQAESDYEGDTDENALPDQDEADQAESDYEGDTDENALPDQDEADQAESESEPILDAAGEMDADEPDTMQQDAEDDQHHDHTEASTDLHVIPQSKLSIASVDSETLVGDGAADSAIDGRVETFWHTERGARASVHPHELVIALGGEYTVSGFRYLPRQDRKIDGMVGRYSFYVSKDGKDWGKAVTTGTFSRDIAEREVTFPEKVGSFVRFVAHSEVNGKPWTSIAELNVLGARSFPVHRSRKWSTAGQ